MHEWLLLRVALLLLIFCVLLGAALVTRLRDSRRNSRVATARPRRTVLDGTLTHVMK
jgi:hypothetical protein